MGLIDLSFLEGAIMIHTCRVLMHSHRGHYQVPRGPLSHGGLIIEGLGNIIPQWQNPRYASIGKNTCISSPCNCRNLEGFLS